MQIWLALARFRHAELLHLPTSLAHRAAHPIEAKLRRASLDSFFTPSPTKNGCKLPLERRRSPRFFRTQIHGTFAPDLALRASAGRRRVAAGVQLCSRYRGRKVNGIGSVQPGMDLLIGDVAHRDDVCRHRLLLECLAPDLLL